MNLNFFCNVSSRKVEATSAGQSFTFPEFTVGDRLKLGIRFTEMVEGMRVERSLPIRAARLTLGIVDAAPADGQWKLKIGSGASTSANTTPAISHDISPSALQATLAALAAVTGALAPVTVTKTAGTFLVKFGAAGGAAELSVPFNTLSPASFARIRERTSTGGVEYEIRLMQSPLAAATVFTRDLPPQPTVATIQDGASDPSATSLIPEIQKLTVPALFRGSYFLRHGLYQKSGILGTDISTDKLKTTLDLLFTTQGYAPEVVESDGGFLIVFNDSESLGLNVPQMAVEVFDAPEGDVTFDLDLNTREAFDALRAAALRKDCVLELEADIVDDDESLGDLEATARTVTLFQAPATLRRELRWDGLAAAASIDWLRPPEAKDYIPFTTDQILNGNMQAFSAAIGDGEEDSFTIDHNLGSELCLVLIRENSAGGLVLTPDLYSVAIDSEDSLTITFPTPPAAGAYFANVVAIGPDSIFQDHTHTIAKIVGLQDALDSIGERLATLEVILPTTGPGAASTQDSGVEIALPETKEALFFKGTASEMKALFTTDTGIDASKLGRGPMLLPAVHDATLTDYSSGDLPAAAANTVWTNVSSGTLNMGRGIYGGKVPHDGFFASDGRVLYAAAHSGSSTSYFPTGFERELFRIFVNDKMLRLNRTLDVQFGLALQLLNATSNAQWLLVVEHGVAPSQSTPATPAMNLENIEWEADPLLSQRLILTGNRQTHSFGARIKRSLVSSVDTITADTLLYGVWEGADALAPAGANFALRARLVQFDTENALAADARGWVAYEVIGAKKEEKPKAIIT